MDFMQMYSPGVPRHRGRLIAGVELTFVIPETTVVLGGAQIRGSLAPLSIMLGTPSAWAT